LIIAIVVVVVLLLCCCCIAVGAIFLTQTQPGKELWQGLFGAVVPSLMAWV
jgi:hypothetical protein